ncbi:MAG: hypothetical protein L6R39_004387, partial [Caloplaca ligustica]
MQAIKSLTADRLLLRRRGTPGVSSHTPSRWNSEDLNPVPQKDKKWEWYHVGGFWIAEGFSAAQIQ